MADKKRIVMVDDEQDLCFLVKENLEATGEFEVITSSQPQGVEELCRKEKPDLILIDNVMPGINGFEIVKKIREDEEIKKIPIIMVSGKGEMVYSKKKKQFQWLPNNPAIQNRKQVIEGKDPEVLSKAYGVDDYISKPFTTEVLIGVIKDVFERYRKRTEEQE